MLKLTRKNLYEVGGRVYRVGYCGAENLLNCTDKIGSNGGVYGWNWSAYRPANDITICTGYRSLTGLDANKITRKFDDMARAVRENYSITWQEREEKIKAIRAAWLDALRAM